MIWFGVPRESETLFDYFFDSMARYKKSAGKGRYVKGCRNQQYYFGLQKDKLQNRNMVLPSTPEAVVQQSETKTLQHKNSQLECKENLHG